MAAPLLPILLAAHAMLSPHWFPVPAVYLSLDQISPGCISGFMFLCLEDFFFFFLEKVLELFFPLFFIYIYFLILSWKEREFLSRQTFLLSSLGAGQSLMQSRFLQAACVISNRHL